MTKSNSTTFEICQCGVRNTAGGNLPVRVDLRGIKAQDLFGDTNNSRESFVDFESCNIVHGQTGLLEGDGEGNGGCGREVNGLNTSISVC